MKFFQLMYPYSLLICQTNSPEPIPSFFLLFISPMILISISLKVFLYILNICMLFTGYFSSMKCWVMRYWMAYLMNESRQLTASSLISLTSRKLLVRRCFLIVSTLNIQFSKSKLFSKVIQTQPSTKVLISTAYIINCSYLMRGRLVFGIGKFLNRSYFRDFSSASIFSMIMSSCSWVMTKHKGSDTAKHFKFEFYDMSLLSELFFVGVTQKSYTIADFWYLKPRIALYVLVESCLHTPCHITHYLLRQIYLQKTQNSTILQLREQHRQI